MLYISQMPYFAQSYRRPFQFFSQFIYHWIRKHCQQFNELLLLNLRWLNVEWTKANSCFKEENNIWHSHFCVMDHEWMPKIIKSSHTHLIMGGNRLFDASLNLHHCMLKIRSWGWYIIPSYLLASLTPTQPTNPPPRNPNENYVCLSQSHSYHDCYMDGDFSNAIAKEATGDNFRWNNKEDILVTT